MISRHITMNHAAEHTSQSDNNFLHAIKLKDELLFPSGIYRRCYKYATLPAIAVFILFQ
jgi:hypothetical protein